MSRPIKAEQLTSKEEYLDAWYAALRSAYGLAVKAYPIDAVRARFQQVRSQHGDLALFDLRIVKPSHRPNELWIIYKNRGDSSVDTQT
jgi:hypothetical protein